MVKTITCIECPKSCRLSVDIENCKVVKIKGDKCPKGKEYAVSEIENPTRVLTSSVLTKGLALKMVPVRTDKPIPKADIFKAMERIKKIKLDRPVYAGDIIVEDFLDLDVKLITTRSANKLSF